MATANIDQTQTTTKVVLDTRLWAGSPPDSTDWLQSPIGSNSAVGALNLLVVDCYITLASTATTLDLASNAITGLAGTTIESVLSVVNNSGAFEIPANISHATGILSFTSPAGTNTDVMRITLLYR